MEKKAFLATVVFVCALFLLGMPANEAKAAFNIHFVEYCDGMQLDLLGGQVYGNHTGCSPPAPAPVLGDIALTFNPVQGFLLTIGSPSVPGLVGTYYIKFDRTFVNYWTAGIGDPPSKFAEGTWDIGPPAPAAAGLPATVPSAPE